MKTKKIPESAAELTGYHLGMLVDAGLSGTSFWKDERRIYAEPYAQALEELHKAGLLAFGSGASIYMDNVQRLHVSRLGDRVRSSIMEGMTDLKAVVEKLNRDPSKTLGEIINPDFCARPFSEILRDMAYEDKYALKSQVPGHIKSVKVSKGERINVGQVLFTVESMMMLLNIKAHRPGVVKDVCVGKGEEVKMGQALLYVE
ncbi:MAG: acetyl-CoA carboxylase biotin carboxyl carrier protein subunit [Candidatus Micrarchaeota archaeon]|nr:acetyl-CoA carboxylase biotin carboxyl carrier protein subunit [Candidatus Micrarchaeota archaeon]MDE1804500.1 acetyl-CoA carboxylase biotin carboxyl carrier protein subunit [Candidatus Micrarchaeota archaeon]MDE1846443.1 acetyl-CoA carboxylase biotin carboxyl carrier protein subunit [Candidatus Micrarchaeota archaeon]